jgi:hypothetical protein
VSRERRQSEGVPTLECHDIGRGRHGVAIIVASPEVSASCLLAQAIGWADAGAPFALIAPDPPPLKWSDLRYVFDIQEDCNDKEAIQA